MSRFSFAEAKGLGWVITHNEQGNDRKPKSIVAEKALSAPGFPDTLVHEEAHSMGLLLERVFAYEAQLVKSGYTAARAAMDARRAVADAEPTPTVES